MRLTARGRYAVTALLDVALHDPDAVALCDISSRHNISLRYLEKLFCQLRRGGLVLSVRGPGGGYVLARSASLITLGDVISVMQEQVDSTSCGGLRNCRGDSICLTHGLWEDLNAYVARFFSGVTLADALRRASSPAVPLRWVRHV